MGERKERGVLRRQLTRTTDRTILIAMDGSSYSDYAFDWYVEHAARPHDYVVIVTCVQPQATIHMEGANADMPPSLHGQRLTLVQSLKERMRDARIIGKVKQTHGSPRTEILRVADEENAVMIITGTRGLGKVRRALLGSVSDYLMHHSNVPVVICRHEGHEQYERRRYQQLKRFHRLQSPRERLYTV